MMRTWTSTIVFYGKSQNWEAESRERVKVQADSDTAAIAQALIQTHLMRHASPGLVTRITSIEVG